LQQLLRYDLDIVNGITGVIKENTITDLILGYRSKNAISENFLGDLTNGILENTDTTVFVNRSLQPISTLKRHVIIIPAFAENELGFQYWLLKVWNISRNTGSKLVFYAADRTINILKEIQHIHQVEAEFKTYNSWNNFAEIASETTESDNILFVLSRKNYPSYNRNMEDVAHHLNSHFSKNSFILIYPMQDIASEEIVKGLNNPSLLPPIEKLDNVLTSVFSYFRRSS